MAHNLENEFTNLDITDTTTVRQEMDKKRKSFKNDIAKIEERLNDFLDKNDNILGLKKILISPTKELIVKKVESLGARLKKENGKDSNLYKEYLRDVRCVYGCQKVFNFFFMIFISIFSKSGWNIND